MPTTTTTHELNDDEVIVTTTTIEHRPRVIDFQDISDAVTIEHDEHYEDRPWETQDGYDHSSRPTRESYDYDRRGYTEEMRHSLVLDLTTDKYDRELVRFYRERGCSKQVTAELLAMSRRDRLDQLAKWYRDGWEWYTVACDYLGAGASVCGVDDYGYADTECRREIAEEVASELEDAGHVIENRPESRTLRNTNQTRDDYRDRLRRNVHLFDVIPS